MEIFPTSFYEVSIILIPKTDEDPTMIIIHQFLIDIQKFYIKYLKMMFKNTSKSSFTMIKLALF